MTVFQDYFYQIHQGEIFEKSQCMTHEHALARFFSSILEMLEYTTTDPVRRKWQRKNKTVVVCLADDFNICSQDIRISPREWFDKNTIVITDNYITRDTQYCVYQLPTSYFGVFSYTPALQDFNPQQGLNFSVNRLDYQRELLLLEFLKQVNRDYYINFNAWDLNGPNNTAQDCSANFLKYWKDLSNRHPHLDALAKETSQHLPIKNHSMTIEQVHASAYINMVVETYAGNTTITFSEKIFRALCTPAPWTLFACKGSVDYLKKLGFDVLDDLIDHSYNQISQDPPNGIVKIQAFITASVAHAEKLKTLDLTTLQMRCKKAAQHNQSRLASMRANWANDFANWLPPVVTELTLR